MESNLTIKFNLKVYKIQMFFIMNELTFGAIPTKIFISLILALMQY